MDESEQTLVPKDWNFTRLIDESIEMIANGINHPERERERESKGREREKDRKRERMLCLE